MLYNWKCFSMSFSPQNVNVILFTILVAHPRIMSVPLEMDSSSIFVPERRRTYKARRRLVEL